MVEESKDELQKMLDKPGKSQYVQKTNLLRDLTENTQRSGRKTSTGARGDCIILLTWTLNRSLQTVDRHDYC